MSKKKIKRDVSLEKRYGNTNLMKDSTIKMRNAQLKLKPIFFGAAIVGTIFVAFNLWGLSSQNTDLLKSVDGLEDNLKLCTRKQKELEESLGSWKKKFDESQQEARKYSTELKSKETIINAQAEEAAKWGDQIRMLESETKRLREALGQKDNELSAKSGEIASLKKELSGSKSKDEELQEAHNKIVELTRELDTVRLQSPVQQRNLPPAKGQRQESVPSEVHGVHIGQKAVQGMIFHGVPLLPYQQPGVPRPKPRFSVADLHGPAPQLVPSGGKSSSSVKPAEFAPALAKPNLEQPAVQVRPGGRYQNVEVGERPKDKLQVDADLAESDKVAIDKEIGHQEAPVLAVPNAQNYQQQQEIDLENDRKVIDIPVAGNIPLDMLNRPEDDENDVNDREQDFDGDQNDV